MRISLVTFSALALAASIPAMAAPDCSLKAAPSPVPARATAVPALSADLPDAGHALGMPDGVFAYASDEGQAVDRVLSRLRAESCAPSPQTAAGGDGAYVPRTKWDNTPYRFNAGGNGKKFSAAEFSAWMEAKGIHVSKGAPQPISQPVTGGAAVQSAPAPSESGQPLK